jgi:hypothetical protein
VAAPDAVLGRAEIADRQRGDCGPERVVRGEDAVVMVLATARLADVLDYMRTCPAPPQRERPGMAH